MNSKLPIILLALAALSSVPLHAAVPQQAIPGVISATASVELIKDGFKGLEGPVTDGNGGLLFSDIPANRTYHLEPGGQINIWREDTRGANGLYLMKDGRLLVVEGAGKRVIAVMPDNKIVVLATQAGGQPLRAPNDLMPDRKGGIYFSDPMPRPTPDTVPKEPGNIYYLTPAGTVLLIDDAIRRPNGVVLSLDERTLYACDTEDEAIYAFDVQPNGTVKNKRVFVKMIELEPSSLGQRSRADGMALDAAGRLYVATSAGVQVVSPRGEHLGIIRLPAVPRNLAFGGPSRHTLFLTALEALYRVELLAEGPRERAK